MSVFQFRRPEKPDPHNSGPARCMGCKHEWVAVSPVGTTALECPACGTMKGLFVHLVGAQPGDLAFECNCGSDALTAYKREGFFRLKCMLCGVDHTEAIFG